MSEVVVVTGSAGFVGQRVVSRLAQARAGPAGPDGSFAAPGRIIAADVVPAPDARSPVEPWLLDLARDPDQRLATALEGADSLVHLAWSHADPVGRVPAQDGLVTPMNLVAMRRVLEAAGRAGIGRFVFVSSATVYGAWPDNPVPLAEDAALRPSPGFAFAVEKAEAERMLAEWSDEHPGVIVTVLRPTVTVGASGPSLYQALAGTRAPQPDDSARPRQFLDVEDLASAIVFTWARCLEGVYNVAPDGWISDDEARALVGGVARVTLPARLARMIAAFSWKVLGSGLPKAARPYSIHPWVVANDRLKAAGWAPQRSNSEALVSSDDRSRWSDLPPSRRQELALLAAGGAVLGLAGAMVGVAVSIVSRHRHRHRQGRRQSG